MGREEVLSSFQGKLQTTLHLGEAGAILGCGFSHDDKTIVSCSTNNKILLWDVNTGGCIGSLDGHNVEATRCSFGKELLATGAKDGLVLLWKYKEQKRASRISSYFA